ncbi:MAG: polysaccharide biosynthesis tyrosine autokinase [Armatimonadetes bacterium]|nr:polysaccharide biosynthesis tyrosine autokinase [Armatimonadota bacterium]
MASIATSQRVLESAIDTLRDLSLNMKVDEILRATRVEPVKDTNIMAIEVTLPDPEVAKVAADVIAAEFKKVYAELNNYSVRQSREFIEAQLATTRKSMIQAQNALRNYKESCGIVELNIQGQALVQRLEMSKTNLVQANAAYMSAAARTKKQGQELQGLPEWEKVSETTALNPIWQQLKQSLLQLESRRAGMLNGNPGESRRGTNHPEVLELQRQIDDVKTQLAEEIKKQYELASSTQAKSTLRQNALDRWIATKIDEVGSQAQVEVLSNEVGQVLSEMASIPEQQAKFAELETDVQSATNTYALMSSKLAEARIKEQKVKNEVALKTIDAAYYIPVNQKQMLKLVLALLLSPLLGIGAAFMLYYLDNTIKTAPEAEKLLGMPVLSAVPESRAHSFARQRCSEMMDVAYQMLTSNLWIASQTRDISGLVVVSAEPNVGRSVVASNLAIALAKEGARVILVDADLRQPTQHLMFGIDNKVGLTNVLAGGASLEDALVPTKIQGLLLVPTGPIPDNPVKLLRSEAMKSLDDQIKSVADFVIYDTPAGVAFPDAVLVAAHVGTALVVHSTGRVSRGSEADLRVRLDSVGVQILGAVLNKVKREDSSIYFHYRRSYEGIAVAQAPSGKKSAKG